MCLSGDRLRRCLHASELPAGSRRGVRRNRAPRSGPEADCHDTRHRAADDRNGAPWRHRAGRRQPAPVRRGQPVSGTGPGRRPARTPAAGRRLREVVPQRRVLLAADQRQLGGRRRRRADQPSHSPGRSPALVRRSAGRSRRDVAARCGAHDRIRGHPQCRCALPQWRNRRAAGRHRVLAGRSRAHRTARHHRYGGDHRRSADAMGREG